VDTRKPLAVALISVAMLPGCAALMGVVGKPRVTDVRPRITRLDFHGIDLAFDVDVHNPYPVSIRTPLVRYGLDIAGTPVVRSEAPVDVDLPAQATGTLALPVGLKYRDVWRTFRKARRGREVDYTLSGAVLFSALGRPFELPLKHRGTFPVLHLPEFSDVTFRLSDVGLGGAGITIEASVTNPNVFDIDIRGLGYTLKVGEIELAGLKASTAGGIGPDQTGRLSLTGRVSAGPAIVRLLRGGGLGRPGLVPEGMIKTPYGDVELPPRRDETNRP